MSENIGGTLPRRSNSSVHASSFISPPPFARKNSTPALSSLEEKELNAFRLNEEEIKQLFWILKDPKKGVPTKDYKKGFKTYKRCFTGRDVVDWFVSNGHAMNQEEAEALALDLYIRKIFRPYRPKTSHLFRSDSNTYYQFTEPEDRSSVEHRDLVTAYRFCVMGAEGVGKSSFCRRWSEDVFTEDTPTDGEISYKKIGMRYPNQQGIVNIELLNTGIIDTNTLDSRLAKYIEWSSGFILVYNRNEHSSFEAIPSLFNAIVRIREFRATPVVVLSTGSDLSEEEIKVSKEEVLNLQTTYRCNVVDVSSVTGSGVNEAVDQLVESARKVKMLSNSSAQRRGWIRIKTKKGSKKRFAVLTQSGLRYYAAEPTSHTDTSNMRGIIPLVQCSIQVTAFSNVSRWHSDPNIHKSNGTNSPTGTITPGTMGRLGLSVNLQNSVGGGSITPSGITSPPVMISPPSSSPSNVTSPISTATERRLSDSSGSGESFDSGMQTPRSRAMTRNESALTASTNFSYKGDKHKIYLMDKGENEYELTLSSTEERDEWLDDLQTAIEKANYGEKRDRRTESVASTEEAVTRFSISELTSPPKSKEKEAPVDIKSMNKAELTQYVVNRFNQNPKKGVQLLRECGLIEDKPVNVALFFNEQQADLRKAAIGEYLGDKDEYNQQVIVEHLKRLDLKGIELDEGIRLFLAFFTLAGEGQQVGRVMEKFADRYVECNPTAFAGSDEALILAFALIMLNTDSHSTTVRTSSKMTKSKFIDNTLNCLRGNHSIVTKEYLTKMYDSITTREIAMEYDRSEFKHWDKQGYLYVKESKNKGGTITKRSGTKLFCILEGYCLYTFRNPVEKKPVHIVPLANLMVQSLGQANEGYAFVLSSPDPKAHIKSATDGKEVLFRELLFMSDDSHSQSQWLMAFTLNLTSALSYTK